MLSSISSALEDLKLGKMIVVIDDEDRENEGDLIMAAEFADDKAINFMTKFGRGLICVPMEEELAYRLDFKPSGNYLGAPRRPHGSTGPSESRNWGQAGSSGGTRSTHQIDRSAQGRYRRPRRYVSESEQDAVVR